MIYLLRHRFSVHLLKQRDTLCTNLGLNYNEFAQRIGLSPQWVREALERKRNIKIGTIEHVALNLGIDPIELLMPCENEPSMMEEPNANPNITFLDIPKRNNRDRPRDL